MSLEEKINADIKDAMRAKDTQKLNALRAIKSAILLAKTEKAGSDVLSPEAELAILQKLAKQRKESMELYRRENRTDLAEEEEIQLAVIQAYLPDMMSNEELEAALKELLAENGITDKSGMGRAMGLAVKKFAGKADNSNISEILKRILNS